jgi:nitrite reductase/ring-hydroxylating ferredoxin subunit
MIVLGLPSRLLKSRYGFPTELKEDVELTHVGPGTPVGELFRRYWQPIGFSQELKDLPKRIRILGEDLVLFRDGAGRVGCLELQCSHRQSSLEFGKVEHEGLRCHYHGWLYDTEGRVLDMPCEPAGAAQKHNLEHPAYPVTEFAGLVFAYMGPPDKKPAFPIYDIFDVGNRRDVVLRGTDIFGDRRPIVGSRAFSWCRDCNWLQLIENSMDTWHVYWLHTRHSGVQFTAALTHRPDISWEETPIGMRNIWKSELPNGNRLVRSIEFIFPNIVLVPFAKGTEEDIQAPYHQKPREAIWVVPVDDYHVTSYTISVVPVEYAEKPIEPTYWFPVLPRIGERTYEERQRAPDDPEAIESIGPIAIHARELLVSSDKGIIMFRRIFKSQLSRLSNGQDPLGIFWDRNHALNIPTRGGVQILAKQ